MTTATDTHPTPLDFESQDTGKLRDAIEAEEAYLTEYFRPTSKQSIANLSPDIHTSEAESFSQDGHTLKKDEVDE